RTRLFPSSVMRSRPGKRPMSTTKAGFDRRIFISGSKLWPPERIFTSSLCSERNFTASGSERAAKYSNEPGIILERPPLGLGIVIGKTPYGFRSQRQVAHLNAERLKRIFHGARDGSRRWDGGALASGFLSQRREGRRRGPMNDFHSRRLRCRTLAIVEIS